MKEPYQTEPTPRGGRLKGRLVSDPRGMVAIWQSPRETPRGHLCKGPIQTEGWFAASMVGCPAKLSQITAL